MTRKLHNTLMAVLASSTLLVVGLIISSPVAPDLDATPSASELPLLDTGAEVATDSIEQADRALLQRSRAMHHRRQSLSMPFFSFAPRS